MLSLQKHCGSRFGSELGATRMSLSSVKLLSETESLCRMIDGLGVTGRPSTAKSIELVLRRAMSSYLRVKNVIVCRPGEAA